MKLQRNYQGVRKPVLQTKIVCQVHRANGWQIKTSDVSQKGGSEKSLGADDVSICKLKFNILRISVHFIYFIYQNLTRAQLINRETPWICGLHLPGQSTTARAEHLLRQQRIYRPNRRLRARSLQFIVYQYSE